MLFVEFPEQPDGRGLTAEVKQPGGSRSWHDLLVISDEIYEELSYEPRSPSAAALPECGADRAASGFNKADAMTGFRIGYGCGRTNWWRP